MSYKSILVCLDDGLHAITRLECAVELAMSNQAHLAGVYLKQPARSDITHAEIQHIVNQHQRIDEFLSKKTIKQRFNGLMEKYETSTDWLELERNDLDTAVRYARMFDLIIAGQRNPDDAILFNTMEGVAETMLLEAGRPLLFIPYTYPHLSSFNTIFLCWNGSREAARAIADALPFLAKAQKVILFTVPEQKPHPPHVPLPKGEIAIYLSRHNIQTEIIKGASTTSNMGNWLLSRAKEFHSDLIVMGGYGHLRLPDILSGSVTNHVLHSMTIPTFMSH